MFTKVPQMIISVISYGSIAIRAARAIREGFLFRSSEYGVADKDSSVFESEEERRKKNAAQIPVIARSEAENKAVSNAENHIDKINKYVPGLGSIINVIFSPNVALVLALIGAVLSFFTPLGIGVGIAAVVLNVAYITSGLVLGALGEQNKQINKQITTVVKELQKDLGEIDKTQNKINAITLAYNIKGIDIKQIFSDREGMKERLQTALDGDHKNQIAPAYSGVRPALEGVARRFPLSGFMLGIGIATLNPLNIGLAVSMAILGESSAIRSDQRNAKITALHAQEMANIRSEMGLPKLEGEQGLKVYAEILSDTKTRKMAMERFSNDYEGIIKAMTDKGITPTNENLRSVFQEEYLAKQPRVSIPIHTLNFGEALLSVINNGMTWSKSINANSPVVPAYEWAYNDNAYKYIAIKEKQRALHPDLTEKELDKAIAAVANNKDHTANEKLGLSKVNIDTAVEKLVVGMENQGHTQNFWQNTVHPQQQSPQQRSTQPPFHS